MHVAPDSSVDKRWKLAAVVAVAVVLRVGLPLFALAVTKAGPQFHEPDTDGYLRVAAEWLRTGRFAVNGEPEILRTPGYALLLLPGIAAGRVDMVTIALQILLACVTVGLVYRIAMQLYSNPTIALLAAWLFACEPLSVIYTGKLLSETLFTTLVAAGLWLLMGYCTSHNRRPLLGAAVCIAAATYVRPISYFMPAWMALTLLLLMARQSSDRRRRLFDIGAFFALAMALIVPWQVRNCLEADYAGFSAISDQNLYFYEGLPVAHDGQGRTPAEREQARLDAGEADPAIYLRHHPEQAEWPPAEHFRYLRREALRTLLAHPGAWAKVHFAGMLGCLTDSGRNAWLNYFGLLATRAPADPAAGGVWQRLITAARERPLVLAIHLLLVAILGIYLLLAFLGILSSLRQTEALFLLSAALYLLLLSGGDAGYHRFRLPLTPVICIFAARGYQTIYERVRGKGKRDSQRWTVEARGIKR